MADLSIVTLRRLCIFAVEVSWDRALQVRVLLGVLETVVH